MGQRTQLLVIEKMIDGTTDKRIYHNQWGFGRQLYNGLMSIGTTLIGGNTLEGELRNLPRFHKMDIDINSYPELQAATLDDINTIQALYKRLDNNNGGLIVEVSWHKDETDKYAIPSPTIRAAFVLGGEGENETADEQWAKKFVSPLRYRQTNGYSFVTDDFYNAFLALTNYMEVEWIVPNDSYDIDELEPCEADNQNDIIL